MGVNNNSGHPKPVNKELLTGRVPVNKDLLAVTVPVNKELLTGKVPVNNLFQKGIHLYMFLVPVEDESPKIMVHAACLAVGLLFLLACLLSVLWRG